MTQPNEGKSLLTIPPGARAEIVANAIRELPAGATAQERQRAVERARDAMHDLEDVSHPQLIEAAKLAVACVVDDVRRRLRRDHWRTHAADLLPTGADEEDKRNAKSMALERLEELPIGMIDSEVQEEIREELEPICAEIETDQRIDKLVEYGRASVGAILTDFYHNGEINRKQWLDFGLQRDLEHEVVEILDDGDYELEGSESEEEVKEIVKEIVAEELELEANEDEADEED